MKEKHTLGQKYMSIYFPNLELFKQTKNDQLVTKVNCWFFLELLN